MIWLRLRWLVVPPFQLEPVASYRRRVICQCNQEYINKAFCIREEVKANRIPGPSTKTKYTLFLYKHCKFSSEVRLLLSHQEKMTSKFAQMLLNHRSSQYKKTLVSSSKLSMNMFCIKYFIRIPLNFFERVRPLVKIFCCVCFWFLL